MKLIQKKQFILKKYLFILIAVFSCVLVNAHEIRPAYLEIKQTAPDQYDILWKVPAIENKILKINPVFPEKFELSELEETLLPDALLKKYKGKFLADLAGQTISVENQEKTLVDVFIQINLLNGNSHTFLLQPNSPKVIIPTQPNFGQVIKLYIFLGIEHILLGIDHLLFVLCLLLLVQSNRILIQTITAFTLAHSITLGLASFDLVHLPQAPVEAIIALSIVFLAKEYLDFQQGKISLTNRYPWIIAFTFGLLHGFGFAGALQEIGFPQQHIFTALLTFNIGVELGQLMFIGIVLLLFLLKKRYLKIIPFWSSKILPYIIGSIASFWLIERIAGFF